MTDRAGLAEALALVARSADEPWRHADHLLEAASIWREVGDRLTEAFAQLGRGPVVWRAEPKAVRIQVLGGFAVSRQGQLVRLSDWQSKRARELLKMLIARRGHPVPRTVLIEALWPDDNADGLNNRLSVALTTIRSVLDPGHQFAAEHFINADKDSVALALESADVDVERFLAAAAEGLARLRQGDAGDAVPILEAAEVAYSGEFLEENLYDDWAAPVREEARAMYSSVARVLARHAAERNEPDAAVRYLLRILEIDRYDEDANLLLVRALSVAGRHGEAHRHYLNYRRAMSELGVEPIPFPATEGAPDSDGRRDGARLARST
jgi:DNA-binding SARP family transcriptional activator